MNNIIDFEKFRSKFTEEETDDIEEVSEVDLIVERIWAGVLQDLERTGCRFSRDTKLYFPSMILVLESIRALYLLANDEHHGLQEFAQDALSEYELDHIFEKETVDTDENMD
jgi:hypothetical protein